VAVTFSNGVAVATNTVNTTTTVDAVGAQIAPFLHLLGGGSPWVSKTIAWLAAVSMALAPFRPRIKIYIADWFNRYSATASADQDAWLMALFSKPWYVGGSLLLRFAGIPLPTKADLERNIALQKETAAAAVIAATVKV